MMKKTVYFSGATDRPSKIDAAIEVAAVKRDAYLEKNVAMIGEICDEDLKLHPWKSGQDLTVIIQLSYFQKEPL